MLAQNNPIPFWNKPRSAVKLSYQYRVERQLAPGGETSIRRCKTLPDAMVPTDLPVVGGGLVSLQHKHWWVTTVLGLEAVRFTISRASSRDHAS